MNIKKIIAILLSVSFVCSVLTACSSKNVDEAAATTTKIVEVTDKDDDIKVTVEDEEESTIELTDKSGNVLTIVPVYNSDGVTVIAGYIESAKDKNGKALTEKEYEYIKTVIALNVDKENNITLRYSADNKLITMTALSDKNGYIIALQDSIDIDKDKDTEEYFKVSTKLDSQKNLFIRLEKDDKGKLINVTVETSADKKTTTVVDETGKKTTASDSKTSINLTVIVEEAKKKDSTTTTTKKNSAPSNSNSNGNGGNSSNTGNSSSDNNNDTPAEPEEEIDYIPIVLKDNGKVACSAKNVTVNEASALNGGTEVIVNCTDGEFDKYYITSETSVFAGQLEFRLEVDDDIEVKINNVNISTSKKTAIKFTNIDSEKEKESDNEETGVGGNTGSSAVTAAPSVEFSITGTNSFKATGSGKNGTVYSECKLAIKGHGSADIDGGDNLSGICSTESITIKNATLNITSRAKQGISCDKKVTIDAGVTLNTNTKGDGIHCNKFEFNGAKTENAPESKITIHSLYSTNCADGIDADDEIIITGGKLDVTALTDGKYALKVRKVIKGNAKGIFKINGGTVTASGAQNTKPQNGTQKVVLAASATACTFTVGSVKSAKDAKSFICSPASVDDVTSSISGKKDVIWSSNVGTVSFN